MKTGEMVIRYGSGRNSATAYTYDNGDGTIWYAIEGSQNVNLCREEDIRPGCNVEEVEDLDTFTWPDGINSEEDMQTAVEA